MSIRALNHDSELDSAIETPTNDTHVQEVVNFL